MYSYICLIFVKFNSEHSNHDDNTVIMTNGKSNVVFLINQIIIASYKSTSFILKTTRLTYHLGKCSNSYQSDPRTSLHRHRGYSHTPRSPTHI